MRKIFKDQLVFFFTFLLLTLPFCISSVLADSTPTGPQLQIVSPVNTTYLSSSVPLVFSATGDVSSLWYFDGQSMIPYSNPDTLSLNEGSYVYSFFANDSHGRVSSATVAFLVNLSSYDSGSSSYTLNDTENLANVSDVGQSCIEKNKKTNAFADSLDNGVMKTVETVASIMYMICTVISAITMVISTLDLLFDNTGGCLCVGLPFTTGLCAGVAGLQTSWKYVTTFTDKICCFVNCGWCTGDGSCAGVFGSNSIMSKGIPGLSTAMNFAHLSPYENIYTAMACFCPVAILFNLRKLKAIYQTYNCCVEEACNNGLSTQSCEVMLNEATCMYWEGSLYKMVVKVVISIITGLIVGLIVKLVAQALLTNCMNAILKLTTIPGTIASVQDAWKWMNERFSEPNCKDLGFDTVKKSVQASEETFSYRLYDNDGSGRFKTMTSNKDKKAVVGVSTSTIATTNPQIDNSKKDIVSFDDSLGNRGAHIETISGSNKLNAPNGLAASDTVTLKEDSNNQIGAGSLGTVTEIYANGNYQVSYTSTKGEEKTLVVIPQHASESIDSAQRVVAGGIDANGNPTKADENEVGYLQCDRTAKVQTLSQEVGEMKSSGQVTLSDGRTAQPDSAGTYHIVDSDGQVTGTSVTTIETTLFVNKNTKFDTVNSVADYYADSGLATKNDYLQEPQELKFGGKPLIGTIIKADNDKDYTIVSDKLYEYSDTKHDWVLSKDPTPVQVDSKLTKTDISLLNQQKANNAAVYSLVWTLLDKTLGSYAYSKIDDMCKEDANSSSWYN